MVLKLLNNTAVLGTGEKPAVFRNGSIGRECNLKNPIWDLNERGIGTWEGGGIGKEDCTEGPHQCCS